MEGEVINEPVPEVQIIDVERSPSSSISSSRGSPSSSLSDSDDLRASILGLKSFLTHF